MISRRYLALACILLLLAPLAATAKNNGIDQAIQVRVGRFEKSGKMGEHHLAAHKVIADYYKARDFQPVRLAPKAGDKLLRAIKESAQDGLNPNDYHLNEIRTLRQNLVAKFDAGLAADLDILYLDALIVLGYHYRFGKVDPSRLDPNWNIYSDVELGAVRRALSQALDSGSPYQYIQALRPKGEVYRLTREALMRLLEIQKAGGWPRVPEGEVLKPGMDDARLETLANRLAASGDYSPKGKNPPVDYSGALVDAVKKFQDRHGLDPDGVVGPATLRAMNLPVEDRINQVRVNLERLRWVMNIQARKFIVVNIAGFETYLVEGRKVVWKGRSQVGKPYRKSPIFKADMTYVEVNPTWTVPPGILKKDVLPAIIKDRQYLVNKNMKVLDQSGKELDPNSIDWDSYKGRGFPYMIRQMPGPANALGRVKLIFPNKHFVFLHDTPSRNLFEQKSRAFSSGCIRVENPFELAALVLDDNEYNQKALEEIRESEETRRINLKTPLPVYLLYWTAYPDLKGGFVFGKDIYGRDQAVLQGLEGDIRPRKRHMVN